MGSWRVDTYRLYLYASRRSAVIRLEEAGGPKHAHLYFREGDLPGNSIAGAFYVLYYPYSFFPVMMEMLREEEPIYVHEYGVHNIYVGTHEEPVGEDEE